jgi:hypothetical protein
MGYIGSQQSYRFLDKMHLKNLFQNNQVSREKWFLKLCFSGITF